MIGSVFEGGGEAKPGALQSFKLAYSDDDAPPVAARAASKATAAANVVVIVVVDAISNICLRLLFLVASSHSDSVKTTRSSSSSSFFSAAAAALALKTTARLLLLLRVLTRTSRSETRRAKGFVDDVRANIAFLLLVWFLFCLREKRSEGKTHLLTGFARVRARPARFFLLISGDDFVY